jgi:hypothetical protein
MADLRADLIAAPVPASMDGAAAQWRRTLWAMVIIQFVAGIAHSMLTPIMPLLLPELGVRGEVGVEPLLGGGIAAGFGLNWVFVMTAAVMAVNLVWVYRRVPEDGGPRTADA